jgi:hypothetical protein
MILGAEIGMLVAGLYSLFTGKFQLSKERIVRGGRARLAGLILLIPLPLALALGAMAANRSSFANQLFNMVPNPIIIEIGIIIIALVVALAIAYTAPREATA